MADVGPPPTPRRPFVLGVAGGSASGKTTVAERLAAATGSSVTLLRLDAYYRDFPELAFAQRAAVNYDHPDAFDWPLLLGHLAALADGRPVEVPVYDFATYRRSPATEPAAAAQVIVVEGILVLYEPALRERFDLKLFVDTDADVRLIRRLRRDITERGRTVDSVIDQYLLTVRAAHLQFVEPTKRYADVIIPEGGMNDPALDVLLARVRELLQGPGPG